MGLKEGRKFVFPIVVIRSNIEYRSRKDHELAHNSNIRIKSAFHGG